jgi:hypothetical protein
MNMLPYDEDEGREGYKQLDEYDTNVFESMEQAQQVYEWFQDNWHPQENGASADDAFSRLTEFDATYNEDGEIETIEYDFDWSP